MIGKTYLRFKNFAEDFKQTGMTAALFKFESDDDAREFRRLAAEAYKYMGGTANLKTAIIRGNIVAILDKDGGPIANS